MYLKELQEKESVRFVLYRLMILKKDGATIFSDDVTRTELKARVSVEDEFIDSFSVYYKTYLNASVLPQQMNDLDNVVPISINGNIEDVKVSQIESMAVIFSYE